LATSHHRTARTTSTRRRSTRVRRAGLLAAGLSAVIAGPPLMPAGAAPGDVTAGSQRDAVAAEVEAAEKQVAEAEEALQRMTLEAEAASDAVLRTRVELARAEKQAAAAAAELAAAEAAVAQMEEDVATLGREAYMGEAAFGDVAVLLDSEDPEDLLQRAAILDLLGEDRVEALHELEDVQVAQAKADRAAREAVAARDEAARAATEAETRANERLEGAQEEFDALTSEKKRLDEELRRAEIELLELQGVRDAAAEQARAAEAEASVNMLSAAAGAVAPTSGRVTSCYGPRWGTMHSGVDIAAPIGTPVYTPDAGVVVDAGPASGFGLAVYVQHADGTITLYGHVNQYFVQPGQTVQAGQQIAEVGNRGQSTGPHLHFEVHTGGLYVNRGNPMPWLSLRGISLGGC
jgi:murein DD-endopeptidase MepM/ murein hydrolase activator NlpD